MDIDKMTIGEMREALKKCLTHKEPAKTKPKKKAEPESSHPAEAYAKKTRAANVALFEKAAAETGAALHKEEEAKKADAAEKAMERAVKRAVSASTVTLAPPAMPVARRPVGIAGMPDRIEHVMPRRKSVAVGTEMPEKKEMAVQTERQPRKQRAKKAVGGGAAAPIDPEEEERARMMIERGLADMPTPVSLGKKKKAPTEYSVFFGEQRAKGKTPKEIGALWKEKKGGK